MACRPDEYAPTRLEELKVAPDTLPSDTSPALRTGDYSGDTARRKSETAKWDHSPTQIVNAVTNGACEMLAIQAAFRRASRNWQRHLTFEDFARDPLRAMQQLLEWASLKPHHTPAQLLQPHHSWLVSRPETNAESFAYALARPDEVLEGLKAVCLDWTFYGSSYGPDARAPQPMCLDAPSCAAARPALHCGCDLPSNEHSARNMFWLENATQPSWWLDQWEA